MKKICAIDTETTGLALGSRLIEIAILPLAGFKPDVSMRPFTAIVNPGCMPEYATSKAMEINRIYPDQLRLDGVPLSDLVPMIKGWMLAHDISQIIPLGQNFCQFDHKILEFELGFEGYNELFHRHAKDTMVLATALNDRDELEGKERRFKSIRLKALCEYFGIPTAGHHRALRDCEMAAEVYLNLLYSEQLPTR